jgi:hypothetical protein
MRYLFVLLTALLTHIAYINSAIAATQSGNDQYVLAAEKIIDEFYSFDSEKLESALDSAKSSIPRIVYYQGWAKGGNYKIVNRMPCEAKNEKLISCSITVKDDLIGAPGIDFNVTDTFEFQCTMEKSFTIRPAQTIRNYIVMRMVGLNVNVLN